MKRFCKFIPDYRRILPLLILLASCSPRYAQSLRQPVALSCVEPAFLKPGDKVALISPSYHTPMENVDAAAKILRDWGLEPVVGAHVGEIHRGRYAGTTQERLADLDVTDTGATVTFDVPGQTRRIRTADALKEAQPLRVDEVDKPAKFVRFIDFRRHFEGIRR